MAGEWLNDLGQQSLRVHRFPRHSRPACIAWTGVWDSAISPSSCPGSGRTSHILLSSIICWPTPIRSPRFITTRLGEYRRAHGIDNPGRPMPDLCTISETIARFHSGSTILAATFAEPRDGSWPRAGRVATRGRTAMRSISPPIPISPQRRRGCNIFAAAQCPPFAARLDPHHVPPPAGCRSIRSRHRRGAI